MKHALSIGLLSALVLVSACSEKDFGMKNYSYTPKVEGEKPASVVAGSSLTKTAEKAGNPDNWKADVTKINGQSTKGAPETVQFSPGMTNMEITVTNKYMTGKDAMRASFDLYVPPAEKYELKFAGIKKGTQMQTLILIDSKKHIVQKWDLSSIEK